MIFLTLMRTYSGDYIYIVLCLLIFRAFPLSETNPGVSLCSAWEKSRYSSYLLIYPVQLNYLWEFTENENVPVRICVCVCVACFCELFCYSRSSKTIIPSPLQSVTSSENELRSQKTLDSRRDPAIH